MSSSQPDRSQFPDRRPPSQPGPTAGGHLPQPVPVRPIPAQPTGAFPQFNLPQQTPPPAGVPQAGFAPAPRGTATAYRRPRRSVWASPFLWILLLLAAAGGGGAWWWSQQRVLEFATTDDQRVAETAPLRFVVRTKTKGLAEGDYQFELTTSPPGARIDAQTGEVSWNPAEAQGPGRYEVRVRATTTDDRPAISAETKFHIVVDESNAPPTLAAITDQTLNLDSQTSLVLQLQAADGDLPPQALRYRLLEGAAAGAAVDSASGKFTLPAAGAKPGQVLNFAVAALDALGATSESVKFRVQVAGSPPPYEQFLKRVEEAGLVLSPLGREPVPLFEVPGRVHSLSTNRLISYEFPSAAAAAAAAKTVAPNASEVGDKPIPYAREADVYLSDRLIFVYIGNTKADPQFVALLGRPVAARSAAAVAKLPSSAVPKPSVETKKSHAAEFATLLELYKQKKLFSPKEYPTIRKFYADRFAKAHAEVLAQIFGADPELTAWLEKNADLKEELYIAIKPEDDVPAVLTLFQELHRQFPAKLKAYAQLAIAVAVTWDDDRNVYRYDGQSRRVHAVMPEQLLSAVDTFRYFVDAEQYMQGRIQFVPWEFLVHTANDRTPVAERIWAMQNYGAKRVMFGECYSQVPYDKEMLRTNDQVCRMADKPYTLENLRQFGGVCAQQADFAARVGKSIGVPAEYVTGEGNLGVPHAWVMWVELKQATPTGIVFSLESHGRYDYDFYYVGHLRDPQTGKRITDRQLELRLQTVGANVTAKRQADLIMAAYLPLGDELKFSIKDQLTFLSDALKLCPGNEEAWRGLAGISKWREVTKADEKLLATALDSLFRTFAQAPDFTWEVFDDLIGFRKQEKDKVALYQRLVQLYDQAQRPDLACEAATILADKLAADGHALEACQGLMGTILRYPKEGRYVPKLIDQIDRLSREFPEADQQLAAFFQKFLPTIPRERSSTPSKYCIAMYEKGIAKFRAVGQESLALAAEAELAKIRAIGQ